MTPSPYSGAIASGSPIQGMSTGLNTMKEKIPSGYRRGSFNKYSPEGQEIWKLLASYAQPNGYLSRLAGGDEELLSQIEEPALRQFSGLQGNIASRFSGQGLGGRKSSGFQNTLSQETSDFAERLQAQRQNLMRQALMDLRGLSQELLGSDPMQNFLVKKERRPSFLQSLLGGAAPLAGAIGGSYLGGPSGGLAGYQIGNAFGQAFQ